jgi:hypothetical protein
MKIGKPRRDIAVVHGAFEVSTGIKDAILNFSVVTRQPQLAHTGLETVHVLSSTSIHCGISEFPS